MTVTALMFHGSLLGFLGLLIWAAYCDATTYKIPNRIPVALALLFPVYALSTGPGFDWLGTALVGGGFFALGFVLFVLRLFGGGDAKLLAATALWAGPALVMPFVFLTAVAGGGLALLLWLHHRLARAGLAGLWARGMADPDFASKPMPYGIAIAAGGFYVAFTIPSLG